MNCQITLPLTHLSLERSLEQYLLLNLFPNFNIDSLSFYSVQSQNSIIYQCPIALKLAKGNLKKTQEINQQIISNFKLIVIKPKIHLKFEVNLTESGLLNFSLNDQEINQWLQSLPDLFLSDASLSLFNEHSLVDCATAGVDRPLSVQTGQQYPCPLEINDEFALQYAYGRCCSLLRLGHLDQLIQLKNLDFDHLAWFWLSPEPVFEQKRLWPQTEERELIHQIIKIIDNINRVSSIKLALNLSQAFLKFEQSCRIWGEVKRQNRTLAQSRLGLIAIVQFLLRYLLTEKLGFIPSTQL